MGFGLEVEMIRLASQKGLLTTPYVFSEADATAMAKAGRISSSAISGSRPAAPSARKPR